MCMCVCDGCTSMYMWHCGADGSRRATSGVALPSPCLFRVTRDFPVSLRARCSQARRLPGLLSLWFRALNWDPPPRRGPASAFPGSPSPSPNQFSTDGAWRALNTANMAARWSHGFSDSPHRALSRSQEVTSGFILQLLGLLVKGFLYFVSYIVCLFWFRM